MRSLSQVTFRNAGGIAYDVLGQMRSPLVDVQVEPLPELAGRWRFTALHLFWQPAATLRTIMIPGVSLDVCTRAVQFPRVEMAHFAYDDPGILNLAAYKYAFPKLRDLRLDQAFHASLSVIPDPRRIRHTNLPAASPEFGWSSLAHVRTSACDLWLLGLYTIVETLSLIVNPGIAIDCLGDVLLATSPRHLCLYFADTGTACAALARPRLRNVLRNPRLSTLVLDLVLPFNGLQFIPFVLHLVISVGYLRCKELTVRFLERVPSQAGSPPVPRPAYIASLRLDQLAQVLLAQCSELRWVTVGAPRMDQPGRMIAYTAQAAPGPAHTGMRPPQ
ncbi:hypothetical protein C8Q77DRAFT_1069994 [Trametes polyzona]|nr:hypothetical protein C8Q77DRAFT_1069994 [Trametes polyzona]